VAKAVKAKWLQTTESSANLLTCSLNLTKLLGATLLEFSSLRSQVSSNHANSCYENISKLYCLTCSGPGYSALHFLLVVIPANKIHKQGWFLNAGYPIFVNSLCISVC
jgi:hypothetical protein